MNRLRKYSYVCFLRHVGEALYGYGKVIESFIYVSVFNAVPYAVLDMALQDNFPAGMERRFCGIDLRKDIFTGDILIYHPVDRLNLPDNLLEAAVKVFRIYTLLHRNFLHENFIAAAGFARKGCDHGI